MSIQKSLHDRVIAGREFRRDEVDSWQLERMIAGGLATALFRKVVTTTPQPVLLADFPGISTLDRQIGPTLT